MPSSSVIILSSIRFTSGNIALKSLAIVQCVAACFPFNKPVPARKKEPIQKVAISAPPLYCSLIQGTKAAFFSIAVFGSPCIAGIIMRSVFLTSLIKPSGLIINNPFLWLISLSHPTSCTLNNGDIPMPALNEFTSLNIWCVPSMFTTLVCPCGMIIEMCFI